MIKKALIFISFFLILIGITHPSEEKSYLVLSGQEGDGLLVDPMQISEGPDGNIYVYDRSDAFIKVYSPEGKYLRRIGGKGQGPGEIQRADGARFRFTHDGKLYFTESFGGHRWITLMKLTGEYHNVIHIRINEVFGVAGSAPLEDGGFLIELWFSFKPEMRKDYFLYRYPQALLRINAAGEIVSEIVRTDYFKTISSKGDGADQWLPFFPSFAWTPFKNESLIFADGLSRNLKVYNYEGALIGEVKTTLPKPEKVKNRDLNEWRKLRKEAVRDQTWFNRFGRVIEKYKKSIYDKKPILSSISFTPDQNLLVSSPWSEERGTDYWLLDDKGRTLTQINLESGWLNISKHFVSLTAEDELGNVRVICIRRGGSESDDLQRVEDLGRAREP